ncbi:MBL fold metallo-hydrolase [Bacillus luteolus]|uniref:MBL fold metallo-hydrolase n=1 Tax=Litchfieldia luteola TaxID=682179 RepID=A0ABR9QIX2_9BACI|nr:MBL fold metallo-hydrolase [Cytobacillus luteolus]MBE4908453.1 MBL fold metallo-hydrolase [Cytobacillus luteolus]MBP1941304.1 glyoxylase-like metal-dependent hydrolase (beta-lactamase superfamily II) [Cytobacillus luteolus]
MNRIGPIVIVEGPNQSKVPFSRSLYIDCSDKVLIDSGGEASSLQTINEEFGIDLIINTHYHPDHTQHNHLFKDALKWINPIEYKTTRTIEGVANENGIYQEWGSKGVEMWRKSLPQEWVENIGQITGTYDYETEYCFGDVKVHFLHTPGHTKGLSCPYFPDQGVVFVGDYDMTSFGPWYNGSDGDIDDFISSGKRLLTLDADTFITGHQKGIFTKQEFKVAMSEFLAIIDKRDERIEHYVRQGLNFEELASVGIFYPKKLLSEPLLQTWERSGIRKHLIRLGLSVPGAKLEYSHS